ILFPVSSILDQAISDYKFEIIYLQRETNTLKNIFPIAGKHTKFEIFYYVVLLSNSFCCCAYSSNVNRHVTYKPFENIFSFLRLIDSSIFQMQAYLMFE